MSKYIGRVLGGFSRITNSEHYIIEMVSQVTGAPYRHQIFIDNSANKAYHLIDGVDEVRDSSVSSARFDVMRFALYSNETSQEVIDSMYALYRKQQIKEFKRYSNI